MDKMKFYEGDGSEENGGVPLYSSSVRGFEEIKRKYRVKKFYVRAFRGVACGQAKGHRFRWFVMTESLEAAAVGKGIGYELHRFFMWLRYWCPDVQYMVVEHRVSGAKHSDYHVLTYGSDKLPLEKMREWWQQHYLSTITGMEEIRNIDRAIRYLAKYLGNKYKGNFVRSWCSHGWVFRGWIGWSKWWHDNFSPDGGYPTEADIAMLSLMSAGEREKVTLGSLTVEKARVKLRRRYGKSYSKLVELRKKRGLPLGVGKRRLEGMKGEDDVSEIGRW